MKPLAILFIPFILATAVPAPAETISGPLSLAISTKKRILVVRAGATEVQRYSVAVGTKKHPTPNGRFSIRHIVWNPDWHPPDAKWAKGKKALPSGHPDNPMKVVKIFVSEPDYYIHGTDDDDSIGEAASHGCIRMSENDAAELARYVQEHAGASRPDTWYDAVSNRGRPASVMLPRGIPIVIGP